MVLWCFCAEMLLMTVDESLIKRWIKKHSRHLWEGCTHLTQPQFTSTRREQRHTQALGGSATISFATSWLITSCLPPQTSAWTYHFSDLPAEKPARALLQLPHSNRTSWFKQLKQQTCWPNRFHLKWFSKPLDEYLLCSCKDVKWALPGEKWGGV